MTVKYARLFDRVKAAFIDSLFLIGMMYAASEIFSLFEAIPNYMRIIVFVVLFLLYEPIFVSQFGGTIGHSFSKIVVKRESNSDKNLNLIVALIRFILKATLGWISLLTIPSNSKGQAIHDFAARSIVIEKID